MSSKDKRIADLEKETAELKEELAEAQKYLSPKQVKSLSKQLKEYKGEIIADIRKQVEEACKKWHGNCDNCHCFDETLNECSFLRDALKGGEVPSVNNTGKFRAGMDTSSRKHVNLPEGTSKPEGGERMKKHRNPDCLYCSDDLIKASEKGITFCDDECRILFDRREMV